MDAFFRSLLEDEKRGPPTQTPKFVNLAAGDDGRGLLDAFFEHPDNFKPLIDPKTGLAEDWGLFPPGDDFRSMSQMNRTMRVQHLYFHTTPPEEQFVEALIERKALDTSKLRKQDYMFKLELRDIPNSKGEPRIWRSFRCSGGTPLFTFADKIIHPVMGWVRNYHCYLFTDCTDGAQFGPEKCDAIDMMHIGRHGWKYIPDTKWCIAHLLQKEGQKAGWVYDLGDNWTHTLTVEAILPEERSTGKVELLGGAGACPREDGESNHNWLKLIQQFDSGSASERREAFDKVKSSLNYKGNIKNNWTPDTFDLKAHRLALAQSLSSPASVYSGTKRNIFQLSPSARGVSPSIYPRKAGEKDVRTKDDDGPFSYMQERVSERKDKGAIAVCANCGSPHNLKRCSGCHKLPYCGHECQKAHWKTHKAECRKVAAAS